MQKKFFKVTNQDLEVTFCSVGASVYSIKYKGEYMNLVFKSKHKYILCDFHGKTIGRVANRIKGNKLVIDNEESILEDNENGNVLHGGRHGLHTRRFIYKLDNNKVEFSYLSRDKESGFPGNVNIKVLYIVANNSLRIDFFAEALDKTTPLNLTNHLYFTLGEQSINNLTLELPSRSYIRTDPKDLTPIDVCELPSCLDFNKEKSLIKDIDDEKLIVDMGRGYDHYLLMDKDYVKLSSPRYKMTIKTDYEGAQIYTDNYYSSIKFINSKLKNRKAIAIEPSKSLLEKNLLRKGEKYHQFIEYKFEEK